MLYSCLICVWVASPVDLHRFVPRRSWRIVCALPARSVELSVVRVRPASKASSTGLLWDKARLTGRPLDKTLGILRKKGRKKEREKERKNRRQPEGKKGRKEGKRKR